MEAARVTTTIGVGRKVDFSISFFGLPLPSLLRRATKNRETRSEKGGDSIGVVYKT